MPIQFACPHCGEAMSVGEQYAGQSGPCRKCQQTITIPGGGSQFSEIAAPAARGGGMSSVAIALIVIAGLSIPVILILVALLLPAVGAAREAARRNQCINNSRQIALGILSYEASHGELPPAYTVDADGKPLHSWRVLILPFIEEQALYSQIDLTKPWDDPVNAVLQSQMPAVYRCPSDPDVGTETNYMVVVGPNTAFPGSTGRKLREISDGTSNTLLVVESGGSGVHWAEPRDIDQANIMGLVGSSHAGGVITVTHCDGSANALTPEGAAAHLVPASTIDGRELQATMP